MPKISNKNFKQKLKNNAFIANVLGRFVEAAVAAGVALTLIFGGVFVGESAPIPLIYIRPEEPTGPIWQGHWRYVNSMWPQIINILPEEPGENGEPPPEEQPIHIPDTAERRELERMVGERINLYREVWNLPELRLDHERLNEVARYRAHEISRHFSRYRPNGADVFEIYPAFNAASENISRGPTTPYGLLNTWVVSVNHREALFDYHSKGFDAVGVGLFVNDGGEHFWVAAFIRERTDEEGEVTQDEFDYWWQQNHPNEERPG